MLSTQELVAKYFGSCEHPYKTYETKISAILRPEQVLLDAGCGYSAPILTKFIGKARELIGVDLENKSDVPSEIKYIQGDISSMDDVPSASVDVVISRAVLEHVRNPDAVFGEVYRVLKPNGYFIFLVPNLYDYASLLSIVIPNKLHKLIVSKTEGRNVEDVFPAYYRANTHRAISRLCRNNGLVIEEFEWLGQYPSYFMFSSFLFLLATYYEKLISRYHCLRFLRGWLLVKVRKFP